MNKKIRELAKELLAAEQATGIEFSKQIGLKIMERDWSSFKALSFNESRLRDRLVAHVLDAVQFGKDSDE